MPARILVLLAVVCATPAAAGDFADAEAAYRAGRYVDARALYERTLAAGDAAEAPLHQVRARLGWTLKRLGDLDAAATTLRVAMEAAHGAEDGHWAHLAGAYLALTLRDSGDIESARALVETNIEYRRREGPPEALLASQLDRAGLDFHDHPSAAYDQYAAALETARAIGDAHREAVALTAMSDLLMRVGDWRVADWLAAQAGDIGERVALAHLVGQSHLRRAAAHLVGEQHARATAHATRALQTIAEDARLRRQAEEILAHAAVRAGRPEDALEHARRGLAVDGAADTERARLHLRAAHALLDLGHLEDAAGTVERAAVLPRSEIEHAYTLGLRGRIALAAGDRAAAERHYADAIARQDRLRDQARYAGAMHFMDAFRADEHLGLLDARLAEGRIDGAHRLLGRLKGWAQSRAQRRAARHARPSIAAGRARLADGPPRAASERRKVPPGVAIVDYLTRADALLVFVVDAHGVTYSRVPIEATELEARVTTAIHGISTGAPDWRSPAARLSEVLLPPPIRRRISGATHLVVVPHGPLHRVPFAALPVEGTLLVERATLSRAPSSDAVLARLARPAPGRPTQVLVVGDPRGDLPGARAEADDVASLYGDNARRLVGAAARLGPVVEGLAQTEGVVHIAAHGHQGAAGQDGWLDLADGPAGGPQRVRLRTGGAQRGG
jgi:tetratricopeptide (TPR) repeat protein